GLLRYASTATPMLRAVPSMIRSAPSTLVAFRSFILSSAISRSLTRLSVPTEPLPAVPEPLSTLSAFLIRSDAGGVFRTNVNERSSKMVISTGITRPACWAVRSLYSFTNPMMLTPCWPRAGPTGGAGVALPAGSCNLTIALTRLATTTLLQLLDLQEIEFHGRLAAEECDQHLELVA